MGMLSCPECGKEAKTARGLAKHMAGGKRYGGHEFDAEEAARLVLRSEGPRGPADLPEEWSDLFVAQLFKAMADGKAFPKVQLERQIGPFVSLFLPEILGGRLGGTFTVPAQEFPLKKPGTFQSTNIDYLVLGASPDRWIFVELKTDRSSIRDTQFEIYRQAMGTSMESLLKDVEAIRARSSSAEKYTTQLRGFQRPAPDHPIELVYLSPPTPDLESKLDQENMHLVSFEDLSSVEVSSHRFEWHLFQEILLPAIEGRP